MTVSETLPVSPDVVLDADSGVVLSEPIEVGPFTQGVVFVHVIKRTGTPTANVDLGISPSGYEDWEHWAVLDTMVELDEQNTYAMQISNFGNWLRLRFKPSAIEDGEELTLLAWFVGDG